MILLLYLPLPPSVPNTLRTLSQCGMRASMTAELVFDNVKIPLENVIGDIGNDSDSRVLYYYPIVHNIKR